MRIAKGAIGLSITVVMLSATAGAALGAVKVDKIGNLKSGQGVDVTWETADGRRQSTREYAGTDGIARVTKPEGSKLIKYSAVSGTSMQSLTATGGLTVTDQLDFGDEFPLFGFTMDDYLDTAITLGTFDASRGWSVGDTAVFVSGVSDGMAGLTLSWADGTAFTGTAVVHAVNEVVAVPAPGALGLGAAAGLGVCGRRRKRAGCSRGAVVTG